MGKELIEIFVKQGEKTFKVTMSGEAVEDIEEIQKKLGAENILEAIVYSIKVLSAGFDVDNGEHEIPIGDKKIKIKIE